MVSNLFGVTALSLKHRQNSNFLLRLGETDALWNLCRLDDGTKDNLIKFKMTSDWESGQCSKAYQSEGPGQAGEIASQEPHVPCSSWMSHTMKDAQSLMEVTKPAKDLEHMESQKQLREVGLFSPEKVQSGSSLFTLTHVKHRESKRQSSQGCRE